ncbi:hypothetical protein FA10DRAFT_109250 [Acaromyces ingoldii]|uniref:Uncharacterized protein n=1 Tax=Acaromyces ingoldii TaxID=215250 RepID=A0A316YNA4_9BASI|nr:hypothetical protein FA10DRAFT_109250 [Acaromyces ingoldii]PWN90294.1 hypothetical protein FA10DRAFT_109250 [Acaromyces ingoldii]
MVRSTPVGGRALASQRRAGTFAEYLFSQSFEPVLGGSWCVSLSLSTVSFGVSTPEPSEQLRRRSRGACEGGM